MSDVKQVIVVRTHYPDGKGGTRKIRWGKLMAQATHAVKKVLFDLGLADVESVVSAAVDPYGESDAVGYLVIPLDAPMMQWVTGLFTAIVLTVDSEEDLLRAYELAGEAGMHRSLVMDAGKTEFKAPCPVCDAKGYTQGRGESYMTHGVTAGMRFDCKTCEGTGKVGVPTNTCIAIGPAPIDEIDKITGKNGAVPTRLP